MKEGRAKKQQRTKFVRLARSIRNARWGGENLWKILGGFETEHGLFVTVQTASLKLSTFQKRED
jgi:hypothetical protein